MPKVEQQNADATMEKEKKIEIQLWANQSYAASKCMQTMCVCVWECVCVCRFVCVSLSVSVA